MDSPKIVSRHKAEMQLREAESCTVRPASVRTDKMVLQIEAEKGALSPEIDF